VEALGEVGRLGVGHAAESTDEAASDDALFSAEDADLETRILRSLEHLMTMETIERLSRVSARDGTVDKDGAAARVEVGEAGQVVDLCVYDDPLRRESSSWLGKRVRHGIGWVAAAA